MTAATLPDFGPKVRRFISQHTRPGVTERFAEAVARNLDPSSDMLARRLVALAQEGDGGFAWALGEVFDRCQNDEQREGMDIAIRLAVAEHGDPEHSDKRLQESFQRAAREERIRREGRRLADEMEAGTAEEIALVTIADLLDRPKPVWLVDGFMQRDTLNLIAGAPGIGKSFVAIDLALSVATGLPFLGDVDTVRGRVLYCAGEGVGGIPERLRSWMAWHGTGIPEWFVLSEAGVNLSNEGSVQRLEQLVIDREIDLVIFDTFRKLSAVADEDKPGEVGIALRNAERVRKARAGCSSLVVHHTNKSDGINGSRAFESEPENVYLLRGSDTSFDIHAVKTKDASGLGFTGLRLKSVGDSAVVIRVGSGPTTDPLLRLNPGVTYTTAELHKVLGDVGSSATRERAIGNLVATGRLVKTARGAYELPSGAVMEVSA